jgi:regulator of protease activity HflC (stomatin/prohibitin superfamily)
MQDRELKLMSGWPAVVAMLLGLGLIGLLIVVAATAPLVWLVPVIVLLGLAWLVCLFGFVVNGPNHARVVQLFGSYVGTLRDVGFFWANPFYVTTKVSLRVRTFETGVTEKPEVKDPATGKVIAPATQTRRPSKVNDRDGTPIEIAAVVVWKVVNAAEAVFNVDRYEEFVHIQSEAALRNLASRYRYDGREEDGFSLRGHIDEVAGQLKREVQDRMTQAGIEVLEARISYLAYAPEIAAAMLQRQQAGAIVAARTLIVEGAVGIVEHALDELAKKGLVDLDPERKAAMVSNLLVVLCGHNVPQPVLNTGTLYN